MAYIMHVILNVAIVVAVILAMVMVLLAMGRLNHYEHETDIEHSTQRLRKDVKSSRSVISHDSVFAGFLVRNQRRPQK